MPSRREPADDPFLFAQGPARGLSKIRFHDWQAAYGRWADVPNVARFAARFEPYGEPGDGRRDALFFGFHRETRDGGEVDLDSLPQDSSLQRAALAGLRGDGVTVTSGRMPLR